MATTYVVGRNMSYDIQGIFTNIMRKPRTPPIPPTHLQQDILKHICTTKDASYKTMVKHTHRSRVTVLQSLDSLVKHTYVAKKRAYPNRVKSKLTFSPTQKGMLYALAFLETDYDAILKAHADVEKISEYNERMRLVSNYELRKRLMNLFSRFVLEEGNFTEDGNLKSTEPEDMINLGLRIGLSLATKDKGFDFRNLFDPKAVGFLRNIYTTEEQRALKKVFMKIKGNLDLIVNQLPD